MARAGSRNGATLPATAAAALAAALSLASPSSAPAQDNDLQQLYSFGQPATPSEAWLLAQGGRLYDNWAETLRVPAPGTPHPAYPDPGGTTAAASWRCVACHGWDYRGREGPAAAAGRMRPAAGGIERAAGRDPAGIMLLLRSTPHGYGPELIDDRALANLALFVSQGQADAAAAIDPASGRALGDAQRGAAVFQNLCAVCHTYDGLAQITGEPGDEPSLGAVARRNPWQVLHKMRNGQPGADMPALRAFDPAIADDVLAYLQTLPSQAP